MNEAQRSADLAVRLARLGDALDVGDDDLAERVVGDIVRGESTRRPRASRWWLAAAAALAIAVVALIPGTRHAVARWFRVAHVEVVIDPHQSVPAAPDTVELPGPGASSIVVVNGRRILVSAIHATLHEPWVHKSVGSIDQIHEVQVRGHDGLWITGGPHTVWFEGVDGAVEQRVAADTLLWNEGDVVYRVEGFTDLVEALAFADRL